MQKARNTEQPGRRKPAANRTAPLRRKQHERSAESAQKLLEVTIELIAEKGYDRTSAAEIGERAGYSRAMVRHRYGSKEDLLKSLLDEFRLRLSHSGRSSGPGLDSALHLLELMHQQADENPGALRAFFVLCMEAVGPVPLLGSWMRDWFAAYREAVQRSLVTGQKDGSVRADLDPAEQAFKVMAFGAGLGYCWALDPKTVNFSAAIKTWQAQLRVDWMPAEVPTSTRRKVRTR